MRTAERSAVVEAARRREITRIQMLRRAIKLPDDEYHDLISNLFHGKSSSTELDSSERGRLITHLVQLQRRLGLQPHRAGRATKAPLPALNSRQWKMFSLWQQLADAGLVRERGMAALKAWVVGHIKVDSWEWLNSHQEGTLIESLKRWLARGHDSGSDSGSGSEAGHV